MKTTFLPHLKNETTAVETRHATSLQTSLSPTPALPHWGGGFPPLGGLRGASTAVVLLEKLGGNEVSNSKKFVKIREISGQKNAKNM